MSAAACFFLSVCISWFEINKFTLFLSILPPGDNFIVPGYYRFGSPLFFRCRNQLNLIHFLGFLRQVYLKLIYTHAVLLTMCSTYARLLLFGNILRPVACPVKISFDNIKNLRLVQAAVKTWDSCSTNVAVY